MRKCHPRLLVLQKLALHGVTKGHSMTVSNLSRVFVLHSEAAFQQEDGNKGIIYCFLGLWSCCLFCLVFFRMGVIYQIRLFNIKSFGNINI